MYIRIYVGIKEKENINIQYKPLCITSETYCVYIFKMCACVNLLPKRAIKYCFRNKKEKYKEQNYKPTTNNLQNVKDAAS